MWLQIWLVLSTSLLYTESAGLTSEEISKFSVSGKYEATVTVDQSNSEYFLITASGIPDHPWEPVNPNTPTNQNYNIKIRKTPTVSTNKACVPFGKIGLTRTGVAIYNPLAGGSVNAVEGGGAETFDSCDGHTSPDGSYHYHKIPDSCLYNNTVDELIGVAFDGFPIYGPNVSDISDRWITSADLDKCHGREVNGQYRYHVTEQWPYSLGCYHGTVYDDVVTVTYNCDLDSNDWDTWTYYLCECPENGGGGGGGGGGGLPPPIECRPDNPNRPANCPDGPQPSQQPATTNNNNAQSGDGNAGSSLSVNWMFVIFIVLKSFKAF
ncbi:unnamed protein product [Mytilus coruscus]|uniref:YHYH domain-containing protein n=1 Tax=Mytilus coruscus TaxID=42192 RepID=A0A6J8F3A5_MYTCO|nr:unnamed protein product [Mytilus coruscus]